MKTVVTSVLACLFILLALPSCQEETFEEVIPTPKHYTDQEYQILHENLNLPEDPYNYVRVFKGFVANNTGATSRDMGTLGRVLFYDKNLSLNNTVSCASCHKAEKGFADDVALSEGFDGRLTERNSLALGSVLNFAVSYAGVNSFSGVGKFFWDERAESVQEQSTETLQNPIEMGMNLDLLSSRLETLPYYQVLFKKAFDYPDQEGKWVNSERITLALEKFINTIVSDDSKFDRGINNKSSPFISFNDVNQPFANFSESENHGKLLFVEHCGSCHGSTGQSTQIAVANNGLDYYYTDKGVGKITGMKKDFGVFKVPMLRNVEVTGPYMHDGRFATLEEVIEHYNSGIQAHENLHEDLVDPETGEPKRLNLSSYDKQALVDFLQTLTEVESMLGPKHSDPFL